MLTKAAGEPFTVEKVKPAAAELCFESRRNLDLVELLFSRGERPASALSASDPPRLLLEASYVP